MPRARDLAYIRTLCGLPLPPQALAQALLPALRGLVPAHSGGVFWVDADGEMTSLYAERLLPPDAMATYYERHYAAAREGFAAAFRQRALCGDPVSFHAFTHDEQESAYFRDVMRRLDAYHALYAILYHNARPFAQISLYRGAAERAFDAADAAALRPLLRYAEAGLGRIAASAPPGDASVVVEEALGIVSLDGERVGAPEDWQRLLRLLALGEVSPRGARHERAATDQFLRDACARLAGRPGAAGEMTRATPWGTFIVRAYALADAQGRPDGRLGLLIRREEARSVALVKGTGASDLAPQQREVALLLAQGLTNRDLAERMGVSLNTAGYHIKQVYARLGVNDRNEVAAKLLQLARGLQ